ncbi:hypothetical protein COCCADRAFT_108590, partial [Bipolaris zeicola 26-R-13]
STPPNASIQSLTRSSNDPHQNKRYLGILFVVHQKFQCCLEDLGRAVYTVVAGAVACVLAF